MDDGTINVAIDTILVWVFQDDLKSWYDLQWLEKYIEHIMLAFRDLFPQQEWSLSWTEHGIKDETYTLHCLSKKSIK